MQRIQMMEKIRLLSRDGKWIKPPSFSKFWLTWAALTIPTILAAVFFHFGLRPLNFVLKSTTPNQYPYIHLVAHAGMIIIYIIMMVYICRTAFRNPGIVPSRPMDIRITDRIEVEFQKRNREYRANQDKHPFKNILQMGVDRNHDFYLPAQDYTLKQQFCHTCQMCKTMRCSHTSGSGQCIQRFDHFCVYFGGDVGLFNHFSFYNMVFMIIFFLAYMGIFSLLIICVDVTILALCPNQNDITKHLICRTRGVNYNDFGLLIVAIIVALLIFFVAIYFMYSINQLVGFHKQLLKTGSLTKEDLMNRQQNYKFVTMFSHFNVWKNLLQTRTNQKKVDVFTSYMQTKNGILDVLRADKSISSFQQLYEKCTEKKLINTLMLELMQYTMTFIQRQGDAYDEFDYLPSFMDENEPLFQEMMEMHKDIARKYSIFEEQRIEQGQNGNVDLTNSAYFYRETLTLLNQKIQIQTLHVKQYFNSYQTSMVAAALSMKDIINNTAKVTEIQTQHPEWFDKTATDVLQLLVCCNPQKPINKSLNKPYKPDTFKPMQEVKTQQREPVKMDTHGRDVDSVPVNLRGMEV